MTCTRQFLNFRWTAHSWRRRVSSSESVPTRETNMWGRAVHGEAVRCQKLDVCEVCGTTSGGVNCLCDTATAERCEIRRAWIDESSQPAAWPDVRAPPCRVSASSDHARGLAWRRPRQPRALERPLVQPWA